MCQQSEQVWPDHTALWNTMQDIVTEGGVHYWYAQLLNLLMTDLLKSVNSSLMYLLCTST